MSSVLKSNNRKQDDFCNNTFFKINNRKHRVYCLSYCLKYLTCCSFYIKCSICSACCVTTHSSRRRHWPMAPSMKRCNSLSHSVTIACFSWLSWIVDIDKPSVEEHPQIAQSTGFKSGLFGGHIWGSITVTFSRRRYVGVFLAVCDGAPSCCRHPCKMPALLLQDVTVSLDNNWDNKHVVVNLLTCVMSCYRSRLVFNCCF